MMEKKLELSTQDVQKKSVGFRKEMDENLQKKRLEIRRETEQLRAQLEELVGSNKTIQSTYTVLPSSSTELDINKAQILKSYNPQTTSKPLTPKETKTSMNKEALHKKTEEAVLKKPTDEAPPCKKKNYNVEEAREYMKRQREQRLEQLRSQKKETVNIRELKKKKIEELQKKSLQLVARNLEAKRERSKSRDRQEDYVRPTLDLNSAFVGRESRATVNKNTVTSRAKSKTASPEKVQQDENIQNDPLRNRKPDNYTQNETNEVLKPSTIKQQVKPERNPNLLYPPDYSILQNKNNETLEETLDEDELEKETPFPPLNAHFINTKNQEPPVDDKPSKKINILSNITLRPAEPAIKEKDPIPMWLKETPAHSDPFNFINSVKRKLQLALNPPTVDVAVQSSLIESPQLDFEKLNAKDQLTNTSSGQTNKTDLRSFISHKCLNLDTKTLEQLALVPKKTSSKEPTVLSSRPVSKTYTPTPCDSESDTSKNIPSISSESGLSVRRNAERVRQLSDSSNLLRVPKISTENLDNMILKHSDIRSSTHTILTDGKYPSDSEVRTQGSSKNRHRLNHSNTETQTNSEKSKYSYSSDIFTDVDSLSKRKESIIAHNCAKISPNSSRSTVTNDKSSSSKGRSSIISHNCAKVSPNRIVDITGNVQSQELIDVDSNTKIETLNRNIEEPQSVPSDSNSKTTNKSGTVSEKTSKVSESKTMKTDNTCSAKPSSYKSLYTEFHESQTVDFVKPHHQKSENSQGSKEKDELKSIPEQNLSSEKEQSFLSGVVPLKEPQVILKAAKEPPKEPRDQNAFMKNICIRSGDKNPNQIHLKFEAEIHLLNDFNESLKHLTEVEKAFESLRSKNDSNITTRAILQNRDTQTSVITKSSKTTVSDENKSHISTINYSRGSEINSELDSDIVFFDDKSITSNNNSIMSNAKSVMSNKSVISNGATSPNKSKDRTSSILSARLLELSNTRADSLVQATRNNNTTTCSFGDFENLHSKNFAGLSLTMFDHLIRDEDTRLENLKTMLKIREQALLDRTKAELAMLEIQKKHLKETGKLQEASLVKKKQRGILLKHQQERHEMQRLKQMQKAASVERKIILKEQRNLIKHQLYTDNMLSKMRVNTPRERRLSGPLKVIQTHNESVRSETSVSKKLSTDSEVQSVTSRTTCSVVSVLSEDGRSEVETREQAGNRKVESRKSGVAATQMKRTLLMREDALKKRNKAVQELLQWHNKLLEEEKRIAELESTANIIISQTPNNNNNNSTTTAVEDHEKYKFRGKQLNQLWLNLTGSDDKKFVDDRVYPMSQIALERFCKSARECSLKSKKVPSKISSSNDVSSVSTDDVNSSPSIPGKQDTLVVSLIKTDTQTQQNLPQTSELASESYSLDFDVVTASEGANIPEMDVLDQSRSKISSISELIDNFSKIKDEISTLSAEQSKKVSAVSSKRLNISGARSPRSDRSASEISSEEPSVIDTTKSSNEEKAESSSHSIVQSIDVLTDQIKDSLAHILTHKSPRTDEDITEEMINKEPLIIKLPLTDVHKESDKTYPSSEETLNSSKMLPEDIKDSEATSLTKDCLSLKQATLSASEVKSDTKSTPDLTDGARILKQPAILSESEVKSISESTPLSSSNLKQQSALNESEVKSVTPNLSEYTPTLKQKATLSVSEDKSITYRTPNLTEATPNLSQPTEPSESEVKSVPKDTPSVVQDASNLYQPKKISENGGSREETTSDISGIPTDKAVQSHADAEESISSQIEEDKPTKTDEVEENLLSKTELGTSKSLTEERLTPLEDIAHKKSVDAKSLEEISPEEEIINTKPLQEDKKGATSLSKELANLQKQSLDADIQKDIENVNSLSIKSSISTKENVHSGQCEEEAASIKSLSLNKNIIQLPLDIMDSSPHIESPTNEYSTDFTSGEDYNVESPKSAQEDHDITNERSSVTIEEIHSPGSKEDINSCEEKEHDSLSGSSSGSSRSPPVTEKIEGREKTAVSLQDSSKEDRTEAAIEISEASVIEESAKHLDDFDDSKSFIDVDEEKSSSSSSSSTKSKSSPSGEKSPRITMDVMKRVSEILAESTPSPRGNRSPRLQDLYQTTYDLVSPPHSPESGSPLDEPKPFALGSEAEELLKKQLAIEQEIKQITEQQQKQQLPYMYVREIPNKPPPPYTPPSSAGSPNVISIVPTKPEEIDEITKYSAKIIYKAYVSNNLENISISDNTLNLIAKNINKDCFKFVFDLCKELAKDHYKQFESETVPSWLQVTQKQKLAVVKPLDAKGLEKYMNRKLAQLFNFQKVKIRENAIIKWSRKKRDHVDEILVMESQAEESQWTNFDRDELEIKNNVTNDIMKMLLKESVDAVKEALAKKSYLY